MNDFSSLRERYPLFLYRDYTITETETEISFSYHFSVPGLSDFCPSWRLQKNGRETLKTDTPLFRKLVFSLGMVELISYWKIACPKKVRVCCGKLTKEQISWWKKQYFYGLGEFFYRNGIKTEESTFMELESEGETLFTNPLSHLNGALIPIGGGKDSIVTLDLLKDFAEENECYLLNPRGAMTGTAEAFGFFKDRQISPVRTLDPNMLRLNKEGFLNGHTPFSAILAFSGLLFCALYGKACLILSNEGSANEATVEGSEVNHQYSKSFQFEKDFCAYEKAYLCTGIQYFSLLRPWSELQIARHFSTLPKLFSVFKSCNAGSKTDSWCGHCSKCLFVWIILSPFLSTDTLRGIFQRNLLEEETLLTDFEGLIGLLPEKPFECVGSIDEINTAICLAIGRMKREGEPLPKLYQKYISTELYHQYSHRPNPYQNAFQKEHLIPEKYLPVIEEATRREIW